nr:hypothetical protein [Nanoarchaeum sp.]
MTLKSKLKEIYVEWKERGEYDSMLASVLGPSNYAPNTSYRIHSWPAEKLDLHARVLEDMIKSHKLSTRYKEVTERLRLYRNRADDLFLEEEMPGYRLHRK